MSIWCRLRPTTRAPVSAASSSQWPLSGSVSTTWAAPHAAAAAP